MNDIQLLDKLAEEEGFSVERLLEMATVEDECYGICRTCHGTQTCEPDATHNYCYGCEEKAVVSCLVLAGII